MFTKRETLMIALATIMFADPTARLDDSEYMVVPPFAQFSAL